MGARGMTGLISCGLISVTLACFATACSNEDEAPGGSPPDSGTAKSTGDAQIPEPVPEGAEGGEGLEGAPSGATDAGHAEDAGASRDAGEGPDAGENIGDDGGAGTDASQVEQPELIAHAGPDQYAIVGEPVKLDAAQSEGAVAYLWDLGDGRNSGALSANPATEVIYENPGRYQVVLTAQDEAGRKRTDSLVVTVTEPLIFAPRSSTTVALIENGAAVAVVSPDSHEVAIFNTGSGGALALRGRMKVPENPRTIAEWGTGKLAVACQDADVVAVLGADLVSEPVIVPLPRGARPYGVVAEPGAGGKLYAALQGTGEVAVLVYDAAGEPVLERIEGGYPDARGIALVPGGGFAVTRFRSADAMGEVNLGNPAPSGAWTFARDEQASSDTEVGGVPTYLGALAVAPTGKMAVAVGLQANIVEGEFVAGIPLAFDTALRSVIAFVDVDTGAELRSRRKQIDNRGFLSSAVFSSHGDFLFSTDRGSRTVERIDSFTGLQSGTILNVGFAPDGLALSADDRYLYVNAYMSRELAVYDVSDFAVLPEAVARVPVPSAEPLAPEILLGKQLFNDSFDTRIAKNGYIACAHCHLDGDADGRTWDFTGRGEGMRNTIALLGKGGAAHGPIHWSGNFDEIQDFEHDIRNAFGGSGLMADADFHAADRDSTLGGKKAGVSPDLDALAAYVSSLTVFPRSPHRNADGSLTAAAQRGKVIFESPGAQCLQCHSGPRLTDSVFTAPDAPLLHDVGTLGPGSGQRLHGPLLGIDTPTLHGLFDSAPYLHDGSAATLQDVLTVRNPADKHGTTSHLSTAEIGDLVAYLLSLDGRAD